MSKIEAIIVDLIIDTFFHLMKEEEIFSLQGFRQALAKAGVKTEDALDINCNFVGWVVPVPMGSYWLNVEIGWIEDDAYGIRIVKGWKNPDQCWKELAEKFC